MRHLRQFRIVAGACAASIVSLVAVLQFLAANLCWRALQRRLDDKLSAQA